MSTDQPTATSYAYDHAYGVTFDLPTMGLRDAQMIALDFEQRFVESDGESVRCEWASYVNDIGGYANFPSYVRALYASGQEADEEAPHSAGLVTVHPTTCQCPYCAAPQPNLAELEAEAKARTPWPKTPSMTRQHFEYLARVIAELPAGANVAEHFAYHLADCNARFDRERFVKAATSR